MKHYLFALLFCLGTFLQAQTPPTQNASLPIKEEPVRVASEETVMLNLPGRPVIELLDYYKQYTGKALIKDANLAGVNISLEIKEGTPKSHAIKMIESVLQLNGYMLIPGENNTVKVINQMSGKQPRSQGIPFYTNKNKLPTGDKIVSYFLVLEFLDPQNVSQVFASYASSSATPYQNITIAPNARALIVTDTATMVRRFVEIAELIDVPPAKVKKRFFQLVRADAERVAETILKLFDKTATGRSSAPGGIPPTPGKALGALGMTEKSLIVGEVKLIPDIRTNRILVVSREINMPLIQELIKQFDQAAKINLPLEWPLKFITASEVLPILETVLMENESSKGGRTPTTPQSTRTAQNSNRSSGSDTGEAIDSSRETPPESRVIGKTRLIADNRSNTIFVIGPPESIEKARVILDGLDRRPYQIYLSALIGQLNMNDTDEFGVDFLQKYANIDVSRLNKGGIASGLINHAASMIRPQGLTSNTALGSALGSLKGLTVFGAVGNTLDAYVRALKSTGRFKILERPSVVTTNNKGAKISSGQKIAIVSSTQTDLNSTTAFNSAVQFQDVKIVLEVTPTVNQDREVTLRVRQLDEAVIATDVINGNSYPRIASRELETTITVPDGQTVVLGGLTTVNNSREITGVPLLSDIPILGYLFRTTSLKKNRNELLVMIQPKVIASPQEMIKISRGEKRRFTVSREAAKELHRKRPSKATIKRARAVIPSTRP